MEELNTQSEGENSYDEKQVIKLDKATSEVGRWLDYRRVRPQVREESEDEIGNLISAVQYGDIIIDDNCNITVKLAFPIGKTEIPEIIIKPRVDLSQIRQQMKGTKPNDLHGTLMAYAAALTGHPKGIFNTIESGDWRLVRAIVGFFL